MRFSILTATSMGVAGVAGGALLPRAEADSSSVRECKVQEICWEGSVAPVCQSDGNLPFDCGRFDNKVERITLDTRAWEFRSTCGLDYRETFDILALVTNTMEDCMRACASYNLNHGRDECRALRFESRDIPGSIRFNYGNCWLKNSTGTEYKGTSITSAAARLTASF